MYWPLSAPRIYVAQRRKRKDAEDVLADVKNDGEKADAVDDAGDDLDDVEDEDDQEAADVEHDDDAILDMCAARNGHFFTTITKASLTVWQTTPVVVLARVTRSKSSTQSYGDNIAVLLRPDSAVAVVQTSGGFLITYGITIDPSARVYQLLRQNEHPAKLTREERVVLEDERAGFAEASIRFRMVIKVDAGISKALALDDELIVATAKAPAAVQCIRWTPAGSGSQTSTELTSRMSWMPKNIGIVNMVHDRAMNLAVWITGDGQAFAVQRTSAGAKDTGAESSRRLFRGHSFHVAEVQGKYATRTAINARFSLIAIACADSGILIYTARDYAGSIPLSHTLEAPASIVTTGLVTSMAYSPDGYCLFAGYEKGWALWSVYGKLQGSSFDADAKLSGLNDEGWLQDIERVCWLGSGSNILFSRRNDDRLWLLEMAKSAATSCFCSSNIARTVLVTNSGLMIYKGYDLPLTTTFSADQSLWQHVPFPPAYQSAQQPMRSIVISPNGRYIAIAGRRGLAHYSMSSSRWKTFKYPEAENSFVVRGGMCWYQHILIAAVETDSQPEIRLYSRERDLDDSKTLFSKALPSSVVTMTITSLDSLLVYTYHNILYHFIIRADAEAVTLVQVGQIALHGIVRAPARVRAMTWILPEYQRCDGDPSQDANCAAVIFLVDAKLVLLQSITDESETVKYDMRVIAHNVEYFDLMRDQLTLPNSGSRSTPGTPSAESFSFEPVDRRLMDSLWYFDGFKMHCWFEVVALVEAASQGAEAALPSTVSIPTDFYPTSISLQRGVLLGVDADLVQRRDTSFAYFRFSIRSDLFLPPVLRQHLIEENTAAASSLARQYSELPYFSHSLEVLLHTVLDDEVDSKPDSSVAQLSHVIAFLATFPDYLDILVQCTRKTDARSWPMLFKYLPPPQQLFDESLAEGKLKTAGSYLIVLQTLDASDGTAEQCTTLFGRAYAAKDLELCKELARFLMALDPSGDILRAALVQFSIKVPTPPKTAASTRAASISDASGRGTSRPASRTGQEQKVERNGIQSRKGSVSSISGSGRESGATTPTMKTKRQRPKSLVNGDGRKAKGVSIEEVADDMDGLDL